MGITWADACDNSGPILRYNCFCMDKTPNHENYQHDLNQVLGIMMR